MLRVQGTQCCLLGRSWGGGPLGVLPATAPHRPGLCQVAFPAGLKATLQQATSTNNGLDGERDRSSEPSKSGEEDARGREEEWIQREGGGRCPSPPVPSPQQSCQKGSSVCPAGLCNSVSFDRHGPFRVGHPASGCVV